MKKVEELLSKIRDSLRKAVLKLRRLNYEIRWIFSKDSMNRKIAERIVDEEMGKAEVGNREAFDHAIRGIKAIEQRLSIDLENLDPNQPDGHDIFNRMVTEEMGVSLSFMREKVYPLAHAKGIHGRYAMSVVGEILYLKYLNPESTDEEVLDIFSNALDSGDRETETRVILYELEMFP